MTNSQSVPPGQVHDMFPTAAASVLAVVGTFVLIRPIGSVWLSDALDSRMLKSVNYPL